MAGPPSDLGRVQRAKVLKGFNVFMITVTLPDGSTRQVPPGAPVLDVARDISPRLADAALAAKVDDRVVDLSYPLDVRRAGADRHVEESRGARDLPPLDRAPARRRRHVALPRHAVRHWSADRRRASSTTSSSSGRSCPRISSASRRRCASWRVRTWSTNGRCGRATRRLTSSAKRGEPLKVQLIEEKTAGQSHVSVYTIKDRDMFVDFCVGPHVPSTNKLKAFKLTSTSNAYWKGDAKNQPMQRVYGTAFFSQKELDEHLTRHRGSEEARSPQARQGARALHVPSLGAGRDVLAARRGRRSTTRSATTCAACCSRPATSR